MSNVSLYKIATMHTGFVLRPAIRLLKWTRVLVTYLQYLSLRHELFAESTGLEAYMTGQVCYLQRLLQLHISPEAVINPEAVDVIMWREDEPLGNSLFIDDTEGQVFFMWTEFGLSEFTVLLPASVIGLLPYTKKLLNKYKLPGTIYTILFR